MSLLAAENRLPSEPPLRVSLDLAPGGIAVRASGALTAKTARPLAALLRRLSRAPRSLQLDLAGIREVDPAGMAPIVALLREPARPGRATICMVDPSPEIQRALDYLAVAG